MSARSELAATIEGALDRSHGIIAWAGPAQEDIAYAILAAGYSKPRTITTAEELDALPAGTIIRDPLPCIKWGDGSWGTFSGDSVGSNRIDFPATVLHTPEASE